MSIEQQREFYEQTLPHIANKLEGLLGPQASTRMPVDCVAFGVSFASIGEDGKTTGYYYAYCSHPERGKQSGCFLTRTDEIEGRETRIKGTECKSRVRKGRKGTAELRAELQKLEGEELPF